MPKYAIIRSKRPNAEGGFIESFELGLVDLNAWGDDYFDLTGYPFPDEVQAFLHDWNNLAGDFRTAKAKVDGDIRASKASLGAGSTSDGEESGTQRVITRAAE